MCWSYVSSEKNADCLMMMMMVLVSLGCCNRIPQTHGQCDLHSKHLFVIVLEAGKPKTISQEIWYLVSTYFLIHRWLSSCYVLRWHRARELSFMKSLSSGLISSPQPHLLIPAHWGILTYELREDTNIQSVTMTVMLVVVLMMTVVVVVIISVPYN